MLPFCIGKCLWSRLSNSQGCSEVAADAHLGAEVSETAVRTLKSERPCVSVLVDNMLRNKCFTKFEYHMVYVLYPFVTHLQIPSWIKPQGVWCNCSRIVFWDNWLKSWLIDWLALRFVKIFLCFLRQMAFIWATAVPLQILTYHRNIISFDVIGPQVICMAINHQYMK
jgi:hypothetical protein